MVRLYFNKNTIGLLLIAVGVVPIAVIVMYNIHLFDFAFPSLDAYLQYVGMCFAFIGSALALVQNDRLAKEKEIEDRKKTLFQGRPRLSIKAQAVHEPCIKLTMTNIGSGTISDIWLQEKYVVGFLSPNCNEVVMLTPVESPREGTTKDRYIQYNWKDGLDSAEAFPSTLNLTVFDANNHRWRCDASVVNVFNDVAIYTCRVTEDTERSESNKHSSAA